MGTRILVTGSRDWTDFTALVEALREWKAPDAVLVHGGARGADRMAAAIWRAWGLTVEEHPADWDRHGRSAGYLRNQQMIAAGADVCLAFILNGSRGTTHCANAAETAGILTQRHHVHDQHKHDDDRDETHNRHRERDWTLFEDTSR